MTDLWPLETPAAPPQAKSPLEITVRTGVGAAHTPLAAFDQALQSAGVADLNLLVLSSVIPAHAVITRSSTPVVSDHGDRLYCVLAKAIADRPGDVAWCGLGWTRREDGKGLFVEHHGGSAGSVVEQIQLSLGDMSARRGGGYGPVEHVLASAHYDDRPACALAVAAYQVQGWEPA